MATYYVAYDGSDLNDGLSPQTAWKTITKAVQTAVSGDTVYIKPGIYDTTYGYFNNPASSTTWIGDVNGEKFNIKGNVYIVANYVNSAGSAGTCIRCDYNQTSITFKNLIFCITGWYPIILFTEVKNFYFENCAFIGSAFFLIRDAGAMCNTKFENCYIEAEYPATWVSTSQFLAENITFENCVLCFQQFYVGRWSPNWTFKNCLLKTRNYAFNLTYDGGYPSSFLIDRCQVNSFGLFNTSLGANTSYKQNHIINSILIYDQNLITAIAYDIQNCVVPKSAPAGFVGNWNVVYGNALCDLVFKESNVLKRNSLNYNELYLSSYAKDAFSTSLYKWSYYKPITITNNDNVDYSDVQVKIVVNTASLVSAGKLRSFCEDLRFTDEQGNLLPSWIEYGENTSSTIIWVKIPSLPASGFNYNKNVLRKSLYAEKV